MTDSKNISPSSKTALLVYLLTCFMFQIVYVIVFIHVSENQLQWLTTGSAALHSERPIVQNNSKRTKKELGNSSSPFRSIEYIRVDGVAWPPVGDSNISLADFKAYDFMRERKRIVRLFFVILTFFTLILVFFSETLSKRMCVSISMSVGLMTLAVPVIF